MGIYAFKCLYICTDSPKYNLIIVNKCIQHCQLRKNNAIDDVVVSTMHSANYLYGSYITTALYE